MIIKKLASSDWLQFKKLLEIFREVFEVNSDSPSDESLTQLLANPGFCVFVVLWEEEIVGGLTLYTLPSYYHHQPQAYIYDVAISPAFQRKGFGRALMAFVNDYCAAHGYSNAYVEAEKEDEDAVEFYRKTNASEEMEAVHFTYRFRQ